MHTSQFQLRTSPHPRATAVHLPVLSVPGGGGISKFCMAQGLGICLPQGQPCAFDKHVVSYNTKYGGFYWKHKQIGSSIKDAKNL